MTLSDNLAVNYATNLTKLMLYDAQGSLLTGSRSVAGNKVSWTLTTPIQITTPTDYTITALVTDNAGNIRTQSTVFTLLTPQAPAITSHTPANASIIKTLANNKISKTITDTNGFGLDADNTSITLTKGERLTLMVTMRFRL